MSKKRTKRTKKNLPKVLSQKQIEQLLSVISNKSKTGIRNRAIILAMSEAGLRSKEVIDLKNTDVDLENSWLHIKTVKGGNDRDIPISKTLENQLRIYSMIRPKHSHYCFSTTLEGKKLFSQYIRSMVKRYAVKSGLGSWIHPHTLRHSFATNTLKREDINTSELQYLLGHKYLSSTQIYTHIEPKDLHKKLRKDKKRNKENKKQKRIEIIKSFEKLFKQQKDLIEAILKEKDLD